MPMMIASPQCWEPFAYSSCRVSAGQGAEPDTNSRDEALGLPAEESARIARRTQRIIAYETRVTNTPDPVGGSEYIENLTDEIEDGVIRILDEIEKTGGTLSAIETRWVQQQIQNAAYDHQRAVESGTQVVVDRLEVKSPPGSEMASTL